MNRKPTIILGLMVTLLAALATGCASQNKPLTPVETAAETWKAMEQQSQGHSPRGKFLLDEPPVVIDSPVDTEAAKRAAQPKLSTLRMSLRMHNADIVAVLQALSRAANKSMVFSPAVSGTINVNIVDRPWDEIFTGILSANQLTYSFDGDTIRVMATADLKGELDLETIRHKTMAERAFALKEGPLVTSVAKVRFADAKQIQKTVESTLTKDKDGKPIGSVQVDDLTNALIIQSVAPDISKVTKLLARLDAPRAQIKLKAHIVETTKEVARDLGILWGGNYTGRVRSGNNLGIAGANSISSKSTTGSTTSTTGTATVGTGNLGPLGVSLPASGVTSSSTGMALDLSFGKTAGNILETQLQALASENKLNIISSPSISTMDNQKAYTEAGERVPYQTVTGTGTNVTYSVNFQDAVLRLEITPHIIDDEFIKLNVLVQKDEVDTSRTVAGNPYILKKKTETTLIARNGETVVISGLSKLTNKLSESGVPGLMDIPGAGWLAKSQSKDDVKDEFMIFITPTVLADWKQDERQKSYEELEKELAQARKTEQELRENGGKSKAVSGRKADVRETPLPDEPIIVRSVSPQTGAAQSTSQRATAGSRDEDVQLKAGAGKPVLGGQQ
ncbi:MAG: type IV pilus secretin PilQ [Humidesulfovibrio sp.]|nr:type IV pilus secretin PilQ [Humidesulfovibrio sp.]